MKKYELTDKTLEINGRMLYQIKALKDFDDVKVGDLGGWIESEQNLSQEGDCWVSDNARVSGDARVSDNARVNGDARVYGKSWVRDDDRVYGNAVVCKNIKR